jgi:hypothetical protein
LILEAILFRTVGIEKGGPGARPIVIEADKRRYRIGSIALLLFLFPGIGSALGETWEVSDYSRFAAGGLTAFVIHEAAHAVVAESFGLRPSFEIRHKPVPFVVVTYDWEPIKGPSGDVAYYLDRDGNPVPHGAQKQFVIASAGINAQNITSEWILTAHPRLYHESRPFLKGMLAFDILTSVGYALVGRKDPDGDLRGMSEALDVNDVVIGGIVLLPAVLDLYRYYHPGSHWIPWIDRGAKGYLLGFSFRW